MTEPGRTEGSKHVSNDMGTLLLMDADNSYGPSISSFCWSNVPNMGTLLLMDADTHITSFNEFVQKRQVLCFGDRAGNRPGFAHQDHSLGDHNSHSQTCTDTYRHT